MQTSCMRVKKAWIWIEFQVILETDHKTEVNQEKDISTEIGLMIDIITVIDLQKDIMTEIDQTTIKIDQMEDDMATMDQYIEIKIDQETLVVTNLETEITIETDHLTEMIAEIDFTIEEINTTEIATKTSRMIDVEEIIEEMIKDEIYQTSDMVTGEITIEIEISRKIDPIAEINNDQNPGIGESKVTADDHLAKAEEIGIIDQKAENLFKTEINLENQKEIIPIKDDQKKDRRTTTEEANLQEKTT